MNTEYGIITLLDKNPRKIKPEALERLAESIERDPAFMKIRPIVIDSENIVIGGNQRLKACVQLGMSELPKGWVVKAADLTEEQRRRFIVIDNAPEGMAGTFDMDMLSESFADLDLSCMGFDLNTDDAEKAIVNILAENISGEKVWSEDHDGTEKRVDKIKSRIDSLSVKDPTAFQRAKMIIIAPESNDALVLVDDALKDLIAELERYAQNGTDSPLAALLEARQPL